MTVSTYAEKKVRPELRRRERSNVKWLKKAEMTGVS